MARIDELIAHVSDKALRADLAAAVADLRKRSQFGLVFEEHVPETVLLPALAPRTGSIVQVRSGSDDGTRYRVVDTNGDMAFVEDLAARTRDTIPTRDLVVIKRFGDPIYPALKSLGRVEHGDCNRPFSVAISGENYHALQLFLYIYEQRFDCIYIDPPYNTGAKDWKYNNRYVDKNDTWRHSKWLSFMKKRLEIAKRLLRPDGSLVVAIDENEHAHLVLLLEKLFPAHDLTSVAIVHNPRGIQGDNFSYVNDFAIFVTPKGQKTISQRLLSPDERDTRDLRDNGGDSLRTNARNCFYPILVKNSTIVGFGDVPLDNFHPESAVVALGKGLCEIWPIDRNGIERKWRYARHSVERISPYLSVVQTKGTRTAPATLQVKLTKPTGRYRTVWTGSRHDANAYGTKLVQALTGTKFPFPKSVFTVKDALHACTADRPDALVLDFFGGSGTTMHATFLLNAETGGRRKCVLVTNNEVSEIEARQLAAEGKFPGDASYEAKGIFNEITRARVTSALTGMDATGQLIERELDGRQMSVGFDENVEFFEITYLDPDDIELGQQFEAILPALWLGAGGIGSRAPGDSSDWLMPADTTFAVLFKENRFRAFLGHLQERDDIKYVWLVTDSEESFAEMTSRVPSTIKTSMLYRDYLRTFQVNTRT